MNTTNDHAPRDNRNTEPAADSLYALTEVLRGVDPNSGKARYITNGPTRLEAYSGAHDSPATFGVERASVNPSRFNFRFEVSDGENKSGADVTAHVWVGEKAWRLSGIADRATGAINWTRANVADTDLRTLENKDFTTREFVERGTYSDMYDITYIRNQLSGSSYVNEKQRERMNEVQTAIDEVDYQLSQAVQDMSSVPAAS